jgi:oligoribonuclease NrnB/cAMP/cGMP phosphodiesterase (DHH superfamily)
MRIVTRPDFDGIVCAALLFEAEEIDAPTLWVEPNDMQNGKIDVREGDIIANLPYHERCALWFDHHYTSLMDRPFNGAFELSASAAGIVYRYYRDRFTRNYDEIVKAADKIDSADFTRDEVHHPEKHPYILLSLTIRGPSDADYWNRIVDLLRKADLARIMADPEVKKRCAEVEGLNRRYEELLAENTKLVGHVAVTDFRKFGKPPEGNRFLVYTLFPESTVHVNIGHMDEDKERIILKIGNSIFNRKNRVNIGAMLTGFNGGGHPGAGSCRFPAEKAEAYISEIIEILLRNEPIESGSEIKR